MGQGGGRETGSKHTLLCTQTGARDGADARGACQPAVRHNRVRNPDWACSCPRALQPHSVTTHVLAARKPKASTQCPCARMHVCCLQCGAAAAARAAAAGDGAPFAAAALHGPPCAVPPGR